MTLPSPDTMFARYRFAALLGALLALPAQSQPADAPPEGGGGSILFEETLIPPGSPSSGAFGSAVAIDGDRAVVTMPFLPVNGGASTGAVYVYTRSGSDWTEEARLDLGANGSDGFGTSVDISGDRIVVGAPFATTFGTLSAGAVFVFERAGGTWTQTTRLDLGSATGSDTFGQAVALDGDRLFVGAPGRRVNNVINAGTTYLYQTDGTTWTRETELRPPVVFQGSGFGSTVALAGGTAVVGAPNVDTHGSLAGDAYAFALFGSTWTYDTALGGGDPADTDRFGTAVSTDGVRIAVGSRFDDDVEGNQGAVYVYAGGRGAWARQARLLGEALPNAELGISIAIDGNAIVAGAARRSASSSGGAQFFAYDPQSAAWSVNGLYSGTSTQSDQFGMAVALDDDRAVIGAPGYRTSMFRAPGRAYIMVGVSPVASADGPAASSALSAPRPNPTRGDAAMTLTLDAPQAVRATLHDALGRTVAVLFDGVAVGQTEITADTRGLAPGVYVVRVAGARLSETRRLTVAR